MKYKINTTEEQIKELVLELKLITNLYLDRKEIIKRLEKIIKINKNFYCKNENFVKNYHGEYCKKQCEECNLTIK